MSLAFKQGGSVENESFYDKLKETVTFWMNNKVNIYANTILYILVFFIKEVEKCKEGIAVWVPPSLGC